MSSKELYSVEKMNGVNKMMMRIYKSWVDAVSAITPYKMGRQSIKKKKKSTVIHCQCGICSSAVI